MTLDEIKAELAAAHDHLPREALSAATAQAASLAPDVRALLDKAGAGVCLTPPQEYLLFYGLHALAAARQPDFCRPLLRLLRRPGYELERLFAGDRCVEIVVALLVSFCTGETEEIQALIADPEVDDLVRSGLFEVLARLAFDGRVSRAEVETILVDFDGVGLPPGDFGWLGWRAAVGLLGLTSLEAQVRARWPESAFRFDEVDWRDWSDELRQAAARPDDPQAFLDQNIAPVDDAAAHLAWIEPLVAEQAEEAAEEAAADPGDPARDVRLARAECEWLDAFLGGDQAPDFSMEMIDGLFCALAIGPNPPALPQAILPGVWDDHPGDDLRAVRFDSPGQEAYARGLLERHWRTVTLRVRAGWPHRPVLFYDSDWRLDGRAWALGFVVGVEQAGRPWDLIDRRDKVGSAAIQGILSLIADEYDPDARPLTIRERRDLIEVLPNAVAALAGRFGGGDANLRARLPARATKIGPNQPCPCGSGKKHKKCCGSRA